MAKALAVLTVKIEYDLNGTSKAALEQVLEYMARRAAGEGMLSGNTTAEVVQWDQDVKWRKP